MNLRPKTKRRLAILLIACTGAGTVLSALVIHGLSRYEQGHLALREQGMAAFEHGDYRTAAADLSRYLIDDRVDPDAIYALAVCRINLPRPDLGHLLDAKKLFMRYLEIRPGDPDAQHHLLQICQELSAPAATLTIADSLLQRDPDDVAALSAKLEQLDHEQKYSEALPISLRLNQLTPLDVPAQITTLDLMCRLGRATADIVGRSDRLLAAHPGDPRFQLLRAAAAFFTNDVDGAKVWLNRAAAGNPPDADFVLLLAKAFDKLGMWDDSRNLLRKSASAPNAASKVKAALAQRLFELDQFDAALQVLKGIDAAKPASDSAVLGLSGLLLFQRDHPTASHPSPRFNGILMALQRRSEDDLIATAWYSLLQVIATSARLDPLQAVRLCHTAARLDPDNADARFSLGMQYLRLGEDELALECLRQAAQLQLEWARPHTVMANILLQRGQVTAAANEAQAACQRNPDSLDAQITRALACYAALRPSAGAADITPLLTYIRQVRDLAADDPRLLAAEVDLLARNHQRREAIDLAIASITSTASPAALCQLESIDRSDHLDLSGLITARAGQCQAGTPELALQQIEVFTTAGQTEAGWRLLPAIEAHKTADWETAALQAREALGDPAVGLAWELFADSLPRDLAVQQAAMKSPAVNANRSLMDRTIDRLKNLTGDDALRWKLARASWQLSPGDEVKDNANSAAAAMAEVVRLAPQYPQPQIIWADALIRLGDNSAAVRHLRLAQSIDPANPEVSLKLAAVLTQQGQIPDALRLLNDLVSDGRISKPQRVETARLYREAGDPDAAIALLKDGEPLHPNDPPRDLLLGQLLAGRGDATAAADLYGALMQQPSITPALVRAAAWFAASNGQMDRARQCLSRLDQLALPDGEKEILLGQFEAAFGTDAAAVAQFQSGASAAPKNPGTWLAWAGLELRDGRFTGAVQVVAKGLKNLPADPSLKAMKERARTLAGLKLDPRMQPLIDSLAADPTSDSASALLAGISDSQTAHESPEALADRIAAIVEQYPRYLPALTMLVQLDGDAGRCDRAQRLANRACALMPAEPEPARLLTLICTSHRQWQESLAAATQWRKCTLDHPQDADLAIAADQFELKHPDLVLDQLSRYLTASINQAAKGGQEPASAAMVVELYLKALYLEDHADEAQAIAGPLAKQSPQWRRRWLRIVALTAKDAQTGGDLIRRVEPMLTPTSLEDDLARGEAWCAIGSRFNDTPSLQTALSIVDPLTDASPVPADVWLLLGDIQQQLGQLRQAETAFTKAVQAAPDSAVARAKLAMVMWLGNEDLHAARELAATAVAAAPASSSAHCTLGQIDEQLGDLEAARAQFDVAVQLDAQNAAALIGDASVQDRTGHDGDVPGLLQQAEAVLQFTHANLTAPVRQELQRLGGKHPGASAAVDAKG